MPTTGVLIGAGLSDFVARNRKLLGATMVTIPGGTFMMGAGTNYGAHQATVSKFQMGRTPVTNEEYGKYVDSLGPNRYALLGINPATTALDVIAVGPSEDEVKSSVMDKAGEIIVAAGLEVIAGAARRSLDSMYVKMYVRPIRGHKHPTGFDSPRQPVIIVNWHDAFVYAFLHGGMLPTEWQWEYAARVVQGREGLREYATPSGHLTHEEAHYDAQSTVDVDDPRYPTLENGLRHMTGNVWEWMQNWYCKYASAEVIDPDGQLQGAAHRSLRGGSWRNYRPADLRAAARDSFHQGHKNDTIGFRVARPVAQAPSRASTSADRVSHSRHAQDARTHAPSRSRQPTALRPNRAFARSARTFARA